MNSDKLTTESTPNVPIGFGPSGTSQTSSSQTSQTSQTSQRTTTSSSQSDSSDDSSDDSNNNAPNNVFEEIITLEHKIFFKCHEFLFEMINQQLRFYGICNRETTTKHNNDTIITTKIANIPKTTFQHNYDEIIAAMGQRKTVLYSLNSDSIIHFHTKILCETIAKQFNVMIIGWNLWDISINGVWYVDLDQTRNMEMIHQLSGAFNAIFIEDFRFFLYFSKLEFTASVNNISLVYYHPNHFEKRFNEIPLENGGKYFMRNFVHCVDQVWVYGDDEHEEFLNTVQYESQLRQYRPKILKSEYIIANIAFNSNAPLIVRDDRCKIVSYDQCLNDLFGWLRENKRKVLSAKVNKPKVNSTLNGIQGLENLENLENLNKLKLNKLNEKNTGYPFEDVQLIWFNETETENFNIKTTHKNVTIFPRNSINFIKCLQNSNVFFTTELTNYTHFNIEMALKCENMICVIPCFFQQYMEHDRCILFNHMNDLVNKTEMIFDLVQSRQDI